MKSMQTFMLGLFSLFALGCASTAVSKLSSQSYPAKAVDAPIEVFTVAPMDRPYEELCLLNARGGQSLFESKSVDALIPGLKEKARACGADAIILKESKEGGYNFGGAADRASASAIAIRFKK